MRIHIIQHVPFETPGFIISWAQEQQHSVSYSRMFESIDFPGPDQFDMLIVMGGPMSVYEEEKYPFLPVEKAFIRSVIVADKKVLGICLGSQLVAEALGAKVYPNKEKEIGWWPVKKVKQEQAVAIAEVLPDSFITFHWHGDTYDLPPGAFHLLSTGACPHQAFIYDNRVMGLQFHTEATPGLVAAMVQHGRHELIPGGYIMSEEAILSEQRYFSNNNQLIAALLDKFIRMTFETFHSSLSATAPPDNSNDYLQSLWYDAKGDWEQAHNIIQDLHDKTAAWIHAYLHRKEGDVFNANYWYNKASRRMPGYSLEQEWEEIVTALL